MNKLEELKVKLEQYMFITDISQKTRKSQFIRARAIFSYVAGMLGFTDQHIASVLDRERTSITSARNLANIKYEKEAMEFRKWLDRNTEPEDKAFIRDVTVKLMCAYIGGGKNFADEADSVMVIDQCTRLAKLINEKTR